MRFRGRRPVSLKPRLPWNRELRCSHFVSIIWIQDTAWFASLSSTESFSVYLSIYLSICKCISGRRPAHMRGGVYDWKMRNATRAHLQGRFASRCCRVSAPAEYTKHYYSPPIPIMGGIALRYRVSAMGFGKLTKLTVGASQTVF